MIVLLLAACTRGFVLDDRELACAEDPYEWGGGLTTHLLNGKKSGAFDYDPADPEVEQIDGSYDLETGEFSWTATYVPDSWRATDEVEGHGTVWVDGDLDTASTLVSKTESSVATYELRDVRLGCDVTRVIEDGNGDIRVYEGTFDGDGLDYVHTYAEGAFVLEASGRWDDDGGFSEEVDLTDGAVTWTSTEAGGSEGAVTREFARSFPELEIGGAWTRDPDGAVEVDIVFDRAGDPRETWAYAVDAAENGEGTLTVGPDGGCDLVFEGGACTQVDCVELTDGPCDPPIHIPDWRVRL
jgi:hypothetical protein